VRRCLIPAALRIDPCPGATGDRIDALRISDEELPSVLAGAGLERSNVHPEVLRFGSVEWLADDYFHAVQEAVKSVMDRLRKRTGLATDGG